MAIDLSRPMMTKAQAAEFLGVSQRTLQRMLASREIEHLEVRGQVRFAPQHLEAYLIRNLKRRAR